LSVFKFYIKDFGCRINQYESRVCAARLTGMGNIRVSEQEADIILVNTCSVTSRAETDSVKYIRRIKRYYPEKEILAIGCTTRGESGRLETAGAAILPGFKYLNNPSAGIDTFYGQTRAFLTIQQGCTGYCSYCVVRDLKKPYYIKSPELVLREIAAIIRNHREIVLCATNFSDYPDLPGLLRDILSLKGNFRWRFSSFPPEMLRKDVLGVLKEDRRFCRHFHIPVQSASDHILNRMNRLYTSKDLNYALDLTAGIFGDVTFSYDIIVGFPGEDDAMFEETCRFVVATVPVRVHVFRYSPRQGTPAFRFPAAVSESVKKARSARMIRLAEEAALENFSLSVGMTKEVLFENQLGGYTREYMPFSLENKHQVNIGDLYRVKVTDYDNARLRGQTIGRG